MRLEDVTAEIRPRVPWESIDMGCALARRHFGVLMKSWLLTVVPIWVVLAVLLRDHPVWFVLCTWWLKPVYGRVPLMVVSRALFGAVPSVAEVLRAWPKLLVRRLWFALVVGRFSPSRSLSMPVSELEGLKGSAYRQRVGLLERNGGEGATMATLAGLLLETVAFFGIIMLVLLMVPADVSQKWWAGVGEFFEYSEYSEMSDGFLWVMAGVRLLSFTLMEPFYVSAGFALYINSRTLTEGWDIELAFKRLSARLRGALKKGGAMLLALTCVGLVVSSQPLQAQSGEGELGLGIGQIMEDEDFIIHHRIEEVPVDSGSASSGNSLSALGRGAATGQLALFGSLVFYVILALVIAGLVFLVYKNRHVFISQGGGDLVRDEPKMREIMGVNITPELLPDDVVAAARKAWREGDFQLALSLLYRGSIVWLVNCADLPITESDTEGDCLRHVEAIRGSRRDEVVLYFTSLTKTWMNVAYGGEKPDDVMLGQLCEAWPFSENRMERGVR